MKSKTAIIICGPTAVGKTSFAIEVAKYFNTEIISFDSRQCFKELNIGVAKPTQQQLQEVQHHFINSHSIQDKITAVSFEKLAIEKCNEILAKKDLVVLVGGTGLYMKTFCEGLDKIPSIDRSIRESILEHYKNFGIEWLQNQIKTIDPIFWKDAEQQNPQRLMRALEVIQATGHSIVSFRNSIKKERSFRIIKIGLELERKKLVERIHKRVDEMCKEGLLNEVKELLEYQNLNALQTVGYKELFDYLNKKTTLEKAKENIKINTRHYAKRQMTWFKKDKEVHWLNTENISIQQIKKLLN